MLQTAIRTAVGTESMNNLYQSARLLRQRIEQFTKTVKTSSSIVITSTLDDVPVELYTGDTKSKSLLVTPYHTAMLPCEKPKATASQQRAREFSINCNNSGVADSYQLTQLGWVVASTLSRMKDEMSSQIPGWAGYNYLMSTSKQLTEVGALPLLPEVANEWSTLLTVMMQAHQLKELTVGEEYITVITYDMALYAKAIELVDDPSLLL